MRPTRDERPSGRAGIIGGERDQTMRKIKCEGCGRRAPSFEIVNYGSMDKGYKQLCYRCFNAEAATAAGLDDFKHVELNPCD